MQHYNDFEWILYRSGLLSKRMMEEMSAHLERCDTCLERYLATLDAPVPVPAGRPAREPIHFQRNSTASRRMRWASAAALIFIFLAILMGITPQGQTVLAQIRNQLEDFGNTLTELFGLPEDSPYVQDVGQSKTIPQNSDVNKTDPTEINIKLDQIILERNSLSYSMLVGGNLPADVSWVRFYESIEINGEHPLVSGSGSSKIVDPNGPVVMSRMTFDSDNPLPNNENIHIQIHLFSMDIFTKTMTERVEGPWIFELDVDGSQLSAATQIYQLSNEFDVNNIRYRTDKLVFSPVRQRLYVRKDRVADVLGETPVPISESRGNLTGFILTTEEGAEIELIYKDASSDGQGVYLIFETDENLYEIMNQSESWHLLPYIARKDWQAAQPGIKGYAPFEEAAFTIQRNLSE